MPLIEERIKQLEEEIRKIPYHKGTEHHIGLLRARIAYLKNELLIPKGAKGKSIGFAPKKAGDATVCLVGLPSVGKSTLLSKLTAAKPKIASYPFTTISVIPGMLLYKGAKIQIFDVPGMVGRAAKGIGHGKEVLSLIRICDLLLILGEAKNFQKQVAQMTKELEETGIRIEKEKPPVEIKKEKGGGIKFLQNESGIAKEKIEEILREAKIVNASVKIWNKVSESDLVDPIFENIVYQLALFVATKSDLYPFKSDQVITISAEKNKGLHELKEKIWQKLKLIRVYLKGKDNQVDFEKPLILKEGQVVLDAAKKISSELAQEIKGAKLWGEEAKFEGQIVSLTHQLSDEDVLSFI